LCPYSVGFVLVLDRLTESHRNACAELQLERIQWAAKLVPSEGLLRFRKNADIDGFVADLSAHTVVTQEVYQLKVSTRPGGGLFEVSMKYDVTYSSFTVKVREATSALVTLFFFYLLKCNLYYLKL